VLYAVNHQDDLGLDCQYVMNNAMTVFGFGRDRYSVSNKQLTYAPGYFTFGFTDAAGHQAVKADLYSAYKPIYVGVGAGESAPGLMAAAMAAAATGVAPAATAATEATIVLMTPVLTTKCWCSIGTSRNKGRARFSPGRARGRW